MGNRLSASLRIPRNAFVASGLRTKRNPLGDTFLLWRTARQRAAAPRHPLLTSLRRAPLPLAATILSVADFCQVRSREEMLWYLCIEKVNWRAFQVPVAAPLPGTFGGTQRACTCVAGPDKSILEGTMMIEWALVDGRAACVRAGGLLHSRT